MIFDVGQYVYILNKQTNILTRGEVVECKRLYFNVRVGSRIYEFMKKEYRERGNIFFLQSYKYKEFPSRDIMLFLTEEMAERERKRDVLLREIKRFYSEQIFSKMSFQSLMDIVTQINECKVREKL